MTHLCNSLRTFSSDLPTERSPSDLNDLVLDVRDELDASAAARLELDLADLPLVQLDASEMRSVVRNVVINAVEATESGDRIEVATHPLENGVELVVRDEGSGIPQSFIDDELFVPFHTTKSGGLGIGLFQSKRIVDAHGGTIRIDSCEGEGTTVAVRIPGTSEESA